MNLKFIIDWLVKLFAFAFNHKLNRLSERSNSLTELKYEAMQEDIDELSDILKKFLLTPQKKKNKIVNLKKEIRNLKLSYAILKFNETEKFRSYYLQTLFEIETNIDSIDEVYIAKIITKINSELEKWYLRH